jgi:hypothetical protein
VRLVREWLQTALLVQVQVVASASDMLLKLRGWQSDGASEDNVFEREANSEDLALQYSVMSRSMQR